MIGGDTPTARIFVNKEGERSAEEGMREGGREGGRLVHRDGGDVVDIWPNMAEEEEKLRENMREARKRGREEQHLTLTGSSAERMSASTWSHAAPTRR